ncbi:hypothetical protein [Lentzea sp. E54]|uniref:hypothetical protein n=1 Tax=Lentzea xerophila TaxID=3435883 RepID=UPI003DA69A7A
MCKVLTLSGKEIGSWPGVKVYQYEGNDHFGPFPDWNWSATEHWHYEVAVFPEGAYWVPASTNPPHWWGQTKTVVGHPQVNKGGVNPNGNEKRPAGIYIWIPKVPDGIKPGHADNDVVCNPPTSPPAGLSLTTNGSTNGLDEAHQRLDTILALAPVGAQDDPPSTFDDSDGLISFVNLSSDLVTKSPEYHTGTDVFDKTANFIASMRSTVFAAMRKGTVKPLPPDPVPTTKWDPAVTHYLQDMLEKTGGLTGYSITNESYSDTQLIAEFSTDFLKLLFDAATVPSSIISGVTSFITGVGTSLRASWDDRSRNYSVAVLSQCHEAVQQSGAGDSAYRYFPKLKYYYLSVSSSQSEFTTTCSTAQKITFEFTYERWVTAVAAAVLDFGSDANKKYIGYLDRAQAANYKDAENRLDQLLSGTVSSGGPSSVDVTAYPAAAVAPSKPLIKI